MINKQRTALAAAHIQPGLLPNLTIHSLTRALTGLHSAPRHLPPTSSPRLRQHTTRNQKTPINMTHHTKHRQMILAILQNPLILAHRAARQPSISIINIPTLHNNPPKNNTKKFTNATYVNDNVSILASVQNCSLRNAIKLGTLT